MNERLFNAIKFRHLFNFTLPIKNRFKELPFYHTNKKVFNENFSSKLFLGSEHLLNIGFLRKQLFQFFKEFTWGFNATLFVEFCFAMQPSKPNWFSQKKNEINIELKIANFLFRGIYNVDSWLILSIINSMNQNSRKLICSQRFPIWRCNNLKIHIM